MKNYKGGTLRKTGSTSRISLFFF